MSVPRARMLGAVLVAGLGLGLSGCSGDSDTSGKAAPAQPAGASTTPSGTATPSPSVSASGSSAPGAVQGAPEGGPALVPGREISSNGARWRVEVVSAVRQADFLKLSTRVTLLEMKPDDDWVMAYEVWVAGAGGSSAQGFELLDLVGKKRYLVARDSAGNCVCTRNVNGIQLVPGQSTILEATFAAPPPSVSKVEVVGPAPIGTFSDVPTS